MIAFYQPRINQGDLSLDPNDSKHCVRILRKRIGDHIIVLDGTGGIHTCIITDDSLLKCEFELVETENHLRPDFYIHIAIAPTKNKDRIEWFVEKSTEIGIDEISFIEAERSVRHSIKLDRIVKKCTEAFKQSRGLFFPKINPMVPLQTFYKNRSDGEESYIAHIDEDNEQNHLKMAHSKKSYCILIGPEGDFTNDEVKMAIRNNFKPVSLGSRRLRTETAGIVACHTLNLINY